MMLAFALFFFVQVSIVPKQWKNSVLCAGLVCGVAWYNYTFMKDQWVHTQISPTTFRYTDWLVTVPLQICEFFFILKASGPVRSGLGLEMFLASIGMVCWLYIVYQVSAGEAYEMSKKLPEGAASKAF